MIDINGVAHTILTVSSFEKALPFYTPLMDFLQMPKVHESETFHYWVGGRTALGLQEQHPEHDGSRFEQFRVGLHHLCFRARNREDVDALGAHLAEVCVPAGGTIIRGPTTGEWAPGYYYVLFDDPDGIRLELCHVPGKGVLQDGVTFGNSNDFGELTN